MLPVRRSPRMSAWTSPPIDGEVRAAGGWTRSPSLGPTFRSEVSLGIHSPSRPRGRTAARPVSSLVCRYGVAGDRDGAVPWPPKRARASAEPPSDSRWTRSPASRRMPQRMRRHPRKRLVRLLAPFHRTGQPRLVRRWREIPGVTRRPDQFVAILTRACRRQLVDHERRQRQRPVVSGLQRAHMGAAADRNRVLMQDDTAPQEIHVAHPQRGRLAPTQPCDSQQQHQRSVPARLDGQPVKLLSRQIHIRPPGFCAAA